MLFWLDKKKKMDLEGGAMNQLEIPSKITDRKFIFMPKTKNVVESDEAWDRCGKWILTIGNADMEFLDKAWKDLQPLLADGTLIWLKASTDRLKHEGATLLCFTRPGIEEIRRAASAIRQIVDFRGCMFYKPNKLTRMGIDTRMGHARICTYMHTYLGKFYKKVLSDNWMPDNEDGERNFYLPSQFLKQNYSGFDPLPSKTENRYISLGDANKGNPHWYRFCSYFEEDDSFLPEVDRVWTVGARLLSEGRVIGLWAYKKGLLGIVRLFVDRNSDVRSQLELCDRIFKDASTRGLMYHRERVDSESMNCTQTERRRKIHFQEQPCGDEVMGSNVKYDYMYTSDGELYETTKFGSVFVMSKSGSSHVPGLNAETRHVSSAEGGMLTSSRSCGMDNEDKDPPKQ